MAKPRYETSCVERFLRYVTIDTQSREGSDSFPSSPGQLDLLRLLAGELEELGLERVELDEHGYLFATIPATSPKKDVPVIGFLAHVDTSPETSGADVRPIVHEKYDGGVLALPDDPEVRIDPAEHPELGGQVGNDIITASGSTLLGADNKAGVAEIVGAAEYLMAHPEILHGPIRVGFTPDEEVGQGTKFFDVGKFGARYAYTVDGESLGQIETETFCADSMLVTFRGFNTHPGFAKGRMVNAIKVAADFIGRLPRERLSPETTEGREGYVHPYTLVAGVERTAVRFLIRDFSTEGLKDKEAFLGRLARETADDHPGCALDLEVEESYRNMKEVLDRHPEATRYAMEAMRRAGLEPRETAIRGGTDGSRLCFMGLPTPNIFAGEHSFHSRTEWISTHDMHKAVEVIVEICRVWEERTNPS
jgi:tripeptide aminopeptidase